MRPGILRFRNLVKITLDVCRESAMSESQIIKKEALFPQGEAKNDQDEIVQNNVMLPKGVVIDILKTLEGLKRKLQPLVK